LGAQNGTALNGRRVRQRKEGGGAGRVPLSDGDELWLGSWTGNTISEVRYRLSF